jgi:hypothetical protein
MSANSMQSLLMLILSQSRAYQLYGNVYFLSSVSGHAYFSALRKPVLQLILLMFAGFGCHHSCIEQQ